MIKVITGDSATPKELLRFIHELDPAAVVAQAGNKYYLKSEIRVVDTGRELMEFAHPIDAETGTAEDAVWLWWDIAVTDLSRASYLAHGPNFYRFNPLGFWEQLTERTMEALDEMHSTLLQEEFRMERAEATAVEARLDALFRQREDPKAEDGSAWRGGWALGAIIGVIWAIRSRKK